jgi:hypothetical protein
VLIGCAGLIVIAGVAMVAIGFFAVNKAKEVGLDPSLMQEQPALAMAKIIAAGDENIEVVDVDENAGRITFRQKDTGKTVTMNTEDLKEGRISFESSEGESFSMEASGSDDNQVIRMKTDEGSYEIGGGSSADIPSWLPAYPGTNPEGLMKQAGPEFNAGAMTFETRDSVTKVMEFYQKAFAEAGMEVQTVQHSGAEAGAMVSGSTGDDTRSAHAMIGAGDGGTTATISYTIKK